MYFIADIWIFETYERIHVIHLVAMTLETLSGYNYCFDTQYSS